MTALPLQVGATLRFGTPSWAHWAGFALVITALLAFDLGVFQKKPREPTLKQALTWSAVWCALAALFGVGVTYLLGPKRGIEFFSAYAVEQALSVDNLFVMLLVFTRFQVPRAFQRRVLVWGIAGAIVLRGALIFAGAALVARFHFVTYAFGALLLYAGAKLVWEIRADARPAVEQAPETAAPSRLEALVARVLPVTDRFDADGRFIVVEDGLRKATPLLLALIAIELADAVFALDSIPAVFAVSTDPFVVFTSNLFAVLGLRSLYFALAGLLDRLVYLKHGLAVVLAIVGMKMLVGHLMTLPEWLTLALVVITLALATAASLFAPPRLNERTASNALES